METQYAKALLPLLFVILLAGCGNNFQALSNGLTGASTSTTAQTVVAPNGIVPEKIETALGSLSLSQVASDLTSKVAQDSNVPKDLDYSVELKVPYGRIYGLAANAVQLMAPFACQWLGDVAVSSPTAYVNGEVPCGSIQDANWKFLVNVPVDPYSDTASGYSVKISGVNIPVYLSRAVRTGNYQEASLDSKQTITKVSSPRFGEDISLRYTPGGQTARLEMCVNVPGGSITSRTQTVNAKASKKILGIKFSYDSDFVIDPGQASFDYARGCFVMNVATLDAGLGVSLATTQNPYLSNVQYGGLQLKIKDWLLRLIDNIMNFFKVSIRKSVVAQITRMANSTADSEVESGQWFTRIHGEDMVVKAGQNLSTRMNQIVTRVGLPSSTADIKTLLQDQCRLIKFSGSTDWTSKLQTFCENEIGDLEITLQPFAADNNSKVAGCYDYFANIHDATAATKSWWNTQCYFKSTFAVHLPVRLNIYTDELKLLLKTHITDLQWPAEWTAAIAKYEIDAYTLDLLLQKLEADGYKQIVPNDWVQNIPEVLAELRLKMGQGTL